MTQEPGTPVSIHTIRKRSDFLVAAASGHKCVKPSILIQCAKRADDHPVDTSLIRAGFTATRKLGGATVRNRAKRRMREAARLLLPQLGKPGHDYVFIGRTKTVQGTFDDLILDVKHALKRLLLPESTKR